MGYEVDFSVKNEELKSNVVSYFANDSWGQKYAREYGIFYSLCTWEYSDFIKELKISIGIENPEDKDNTSFYIKLGDLRKIADAIRVFKKTEGFQKYYKYAQVFNSPNLHVYDPDFPFSIVNEEDRSEWDCWLTINQAYEMKRALVEPGYYMEELWDVFRCDGGYPGDLPDAVNEIFAGVSDDELILVQESY